jgi:hypothetical protein
MTFSSGFPIYNGLPRPGLLGKAPRVLERPGWMGIRAVKSRRLIKS